MYIQKKFKELLRDHFKIRSGFFGLLQAKGDAVIFMNSDFQDPVELIPNYIESWEKGHRITMGQKIATNDFFLMKLIKRFFHKLLFIISEVKMPLYTTGS